MTDLSNPLGDLGYSCERFAHQGIDRPVFSKGIGPSLLVMHELPGLAPTCLRFAQRLIDAGFQVHLPLLFGQPLEHAPLRQLRRLCISEEFGRLAAGTSAPITAWLRALASHLATSQGCQRIGAIGMCLTGAFVIPLILEPAVHVGVVSQPSVPFRLSYRLTGLGAGQWMTELNVAEADLQAAARSAREAGKRVLVQHFRGDRLSPAARNRRIADAFGDQARLDDHAGPSSPWRRLFDPPHALLTEEYDRVPDPAPDDASRVALQRVIAWLRDGLVGPDASAPAG